MTELANDDQQKVWRYQQSREQTLLQIVFMMWMELHKPAEQQNLASLEDDIREAGYSWALPTLNQIDDDELLTAGQLADLLGYSESTVRVWPSRHGIAQYGGRYRWGDIDQFLRSRNSKSKSVS